MPTNVSTQCFAFPHVNALPMTSQLYLLPDFPSACHVCPVRGAQMLFAAVAGMPAGARSNIAEAAMTKSVASLSIGLPFLSGCLEQPLERHRGPLREAADRSDRPFELAQHDLVLADEHRAAVDDAVV